MRIHKAISLLGRAVPSSKRDKFEKAATITAGTLAAAWVVIRLKRELYGPGGTRLSSYDPKVDEEYWKERRRKS
jgi:hypothetical protein